ncbi:MAG: DUF4124 domain-containing protein [Proteobacteria bacterium]|nr:DUF4124 domain-containing protein [Pseudomonadota bacterium]
MRGNDVPKTYIFNDNRYIPVTIQVAVIVELTYDVVMRKYLLLLLIVSAVAQADIYRIVDEFGNASYSDKADSRAEQIELEEPSIYTPTAVPIEIKEIDIIDEQTDIEVPDYKLIITSPKHDENIWGNAGTLIISVTITPELSAERGDQLIFKLDGKQLAPAQSATSFTVESLERGSHIALVTVVDKAGEVIRSSKSVLFHIHRNSKKAVQLPAN